MANILSGILSAAFVIVHAAGLGTAIFLLIKYKSTSAVLAVIAFVLLLVEDIGTGLRSAFLDDLLFRQLSGSVSTAMESFNCFCGLLRLAAIVCLIFAVGEAIRKGARQSV